MSLDVRFSHLRQDIIGQLNLLLTTESPTTQRVALFNILQYVTDLFTAMGVPKEEFIRTVEEVWSLYERDKAAEAVRVSRSGDSESAF